MRIALIGATGLIGRSLAPLLACGNELLILSRRSAFVEGAREIVSPIEAWPDLIAREAVDVAVSALGTTWRKAGGWPAFQAIDRTAVVDFARAARAAGARQMISVSSVGADPSARNSYLALKGRAEEDLAALGFARLDLMRPGLLRGPRGSDRRLGERAAILLSPMVNLMLRGRFDRYAAIDASQVAVAIAGLVGRPEKGHFVHHNRDIRLH